MSTAWAISAAMGATWPPPIPAPPSDLIGLGVSKPTRTPTAVGSGPLAPSTPTNEASLYPSLVPVFPGKRTGAPDASTTCPAIDRAVPRLVTAASRSWSWDSRGLSTLRSSVSRSQISRPSGCSMRWTRP